MPGCERFITSLGHSLFLRLLPKLIRKIFHICEVQLTKILLYTPSISRSSRFQGFRFAVSTTRNLQTHAIRGFGRFIFLPLHILSSSGLANSNGRRRSSLAVSLQPLVAAQSFKPLRFVLPGLFYSYNNRYAHVKSFVFYTLKFLVLYIFFSMLFEVDRKELIGIENMLTFSS